MKTRSGVIGAVVSPFSNQRINGMMNWLKTAGNRLLKGADNG